MDRSKSSRRGAVAARPMTWWSWAIIGLALLAAAAASAQSTPSPPAVGAPDSGVIKPPVTDPAIRTVPTPATGDAQKMVIAPPGTPGGDPTVIPK